MFGLLVPKTSSPTLLPPWHTALCPSRCISDGTVKVKIFKLGQAKSIQCDISAKGEELYVDQYHMCLEPSLYDQ